VFFSVTTRKSPSGAKATASGYGAAVTESAAGLMSSCAPPMRTTIIERSTVLAAACLLLTIATGCRRPPDGSTYAYPPTRTVDVVDVYHAKTVADPYRWLEDLSSSEVREWAEAQRRIALPQRPELFRVAIAEAPITDTLRYDRGRHVPQFGSAHDPAQFGFLFAYSPQHHIKAGTCYPATLVTTA